MDLITAFILYNVFYTKGWMTQLFTVHNPIWLNIYQDLLSIKSILKNKI